MPDKPTDPVQPCPKRTKRGATREQEGRALSDDHYADSARHEDNCCATR